MQRRAHRLLHLAVRRRLSVRAVPAANRQRAPPAIRRDLDAFAAADRRPRTSACGICRPVRPAATCPRARDARVSPTWKATCAGRHRPTARSRRCGRWRRPRVPTTHRPATKECSHERRETRSGDGATSSSRRRRANGRIKSPRSRGSRSSKPWRSRAARSTRRAVAASPSGRTHRPGMTRDQSAVVAGAAPALLADALRRYGRVCLRATGRSMLPAIEPGDVLRIEHATADLIQPGDVILYDVGGRLIAHRVVRSAVDNGVVHLITRGDSHWWTDPPIASAQLLGRVIGIPPLHGGGPCEGCASCASGAACESARHRAPRSRLVLPQRDERIDPRCPAGRPEARLKSRHEQRQRNNARTQADRRPARSRPAAPGIAPLRRCRAGRTPSRSAADATLGRPPCAGCRRRWRRAPCGRRSRVSAARPRSTSRRRRRRSPARRPSTANAPSSARLNRGVAYSSVLSSASSV